MKIKLIVVPYDSGRRSYRMGRGPKHLIESGLVHSLEQAGHTVRSTTVEAAGDDVTCAFALAKIDAPDLYLHIDLDALDPGELVANEFATPYGLSMHTLDDAIAAAKATRRIAALALTAYDPTADTDDRGPSVAVHVIRRVCEGVSV